MIGAALGAILAFQTAQTPRPIAVDVEVFPGLDGPKTVGCLALRAGLTLKAKDADFGGYSDLLFEGPTDPLVLVSDAGHLARMDVVIDEDGDIVGVSSAATTALIERDGSVLGKRDGDAEGIAPLGATYAVSFEGEDRIARMGRGGVLGDTLYPAAADERIMGGNSGFEGLARLRGGDLIAITEGTDAGGRAIVRTGRMRTPLPEWALAAYRPAKDFRVTGASADRLTGDLFILERAFSPLRGARMRIVRVPASALGDDLIEGQELTRMGFLEGIDNMEGIAAARTAEGALRLYLISDDNYSATQRTVLLTLGLAPGCQDGDTAKAPARGDAATQ